MFASERTIELTDHHDRRRFVTRDTLSNNAAPVTGYIGLLF
jgi:hypothetical protein